MVSGRFIKVFYKTTTCPRWPLLSGPKSGRPSYTGLTVKLNDNNDSKCNYSNSSGNNNNNNGYKFNYDNNEDMIIILIIMRFFDNND